MPAVRIKDHWREQHLFDQRSVVAAGVIALLTFALLVRLFLLQVVRHDYYTDLSQGNRVRTEPIPAARGLILDRNGEVIAGNQPAYQLELVPEEVPDLKGTLKALVDLGLIRAEEVDELIRTIHSRRSFDTVPIRLRMSDEDVARFAVHRFEFPGLDIRTRQTRWYPNGNLGVHALGYVGAISEQDLERIDRSAYAGTTLIGKLGVESAYETQLHGTNGFRELLVNAQGRSVDKQGAFIPNLRTKAPLAGYDVMLSLDLKTQRAAEAAMQGHRGAVVALDPNNGDVIALASLPGFDPTLFGRGITAAEYNGLQQDIDRPMFNRALRGAYPPGSTVKPGIALAAQVYHVIDPNTTRFCPGFFYLPGSSHRYREPFKEKPHGHIAMEDAIAHSCDVYFYGVVDLLGIDHFAAFMGQFGFGRITGIDIGGEKSGILPSREWKAKTFTRAADKVWFPGETVNLGIGQGYMTATPMQLAHYVSVLANRGQSWRPRLVTALRDSMTGAIRRVPPVSDGKITSATPQEWQVVFNGMVGAATRGTAHLIAIGAQYPIAGKTGTAQVFTVAQNEKYNEKQVDERLRDHSWFIAFAPADSPRIAVAVLVENGGFGAAVAAPIARKVMDTFLLGPDGKLKPADPNSTPAVPAPQSAPGEKPVEPVNPPPQQPDTKQADTPAAARQQHG
jgi:penicillin-binding protein 2